MKFIETMLMNSGGEIELLEEHINRIVHTRASILAGPSMHPTARPITPTENHQHIRSILLEDIAAMLRGTDSTSGSEFRRYRTVYEVDASRPGEFSPFSKISTFTPRHLSIIARIDIPDANYPYKYEDRRLFDSLKEMYPDFDEILITRNGVLSDGTFTNLLYYPTQTELQTMENGCENLTALTPERPLLKGCRRSRLLSEGRILPVMLRWQELERAGRIGFINALNPPGQLGCVSPGVVTDLGKARAADFVR